MSKFTMKNPAFVKRCEKQDAWLYERERIELAKRDRPMEYLWACRTCDADGKHNSAMRMSDSLRDHWGHDVWMDSTKTRYEKN